MERGLKISLCLILAVNMVASTPAPATPVVNCLDFSNSQAVTQLVADQSTEDVASYVIKIFPSSICKFYSEGGPMQLDF